MSESFEHDVFISYAHRDDEPLVGERQGWITDFHRALEMRLAQLVGRQVRIWSDSTHLTGSEKPTAAIEEALASSRVVVVVVSPSYLASDWCRKELETLSEQGRPIFKVVKSQVRREDEPPALRDRLGYRFFELDPGSDRARELHPATERARFLHRLDDLAQDIVAALEGPTPAPSAAAAAEAPPRKTPEGRVFLCYARQNERFALSLATQLKGRGVDVWVDQWEISEGSDWDRAIDEALDESAQLLVVLSPDAVRSAEVRAELMTAQQEGIRVVPVLHQRCRVPRRLRLIQHFDFVDRDPADRSLIERLAESLSSGA